MERGLGDGGTGGGRAEIKSCRDGEERGGEKRGDGGWGRGW